jgi:hypothetical protein
MSNNPNWIWIYTFSVESSITNMDVRLLFAMLSAIRCEFIGLAWEFNQYRQKLKREGFILKDIKRRRQVAVEDVP